ncbi:3-methyladenine DNA glycosylase [Leekyejoonella antrihumi]|uniref:3-methyladenine DNA glycosylase n=1 Tax=Leekyejoonella antrihumi TaxID=1660198 RepID=A0A563DT34_9MICO|nr:3-methyladenine DNA glycosylase [Leekyejoonella antrihumi]TWP33319.1 3-methyladenine DNA glycosylase [Leekyejoonella antrihumi]
MAQVLSPAQWQPLQQAHQTRVDQATSMHRRRRADGRPHPVEDFLFTYYSHRPAALRRWHPGAGVRLAEAPSHADWRFYADADGAAYVDVGAFLAARSDTVVFVRDLLHATLARPAHLGCFGLHEWAMVYDTQQGGVRHSDWPLRLGHDGTDDVVRSHTVKCSHFDAFRFFTESARPLNTVAPTRDTQVAMEQPGCLHGGMDVYKWCYKLTPIVPSDLTMDAFDLAREIRGLDMRAAPYDLRELGYEPIRIETAQGKAEYVRRQREFSQRANTLRRRLIDVCDQILPR